MMTTTIVTVETSTQLFNVLKIVTNLPGITSYCLTAGRTEEKAGESRLVFYPRPTGLRWIWG